MISQDRMDLSEALERLHDNSKPNTKDLASESDDRNESWDLNTGFKKARELAHVGWVEKANELWKYISVLAPKIELGIKSQYSTSGDCVDVGRFLSNEPECMIDTTVSTQSSVNVQVNISASAGIDARYIFNRGIALATIIHSLQSSGYGVSLTIGESVESGSHKHDTYVEIQKFGDYINPARLAFWVAHPAALRRCIFRFNEQQDEKIRNMMGFRDGYGYGMPSDFSKDTTSPETVVIPHMDRYAASRYDSPEAAIKELVKLFAEKGVPVSLDQSAID